MLGLDKLVYVSGAGFKHWFLDANPTHKECVGKVTGSKNTETCMGGRSVLLAVQTTYTKIVHRLRRSRVVVDFPSYRFPCLDLFPTSSHDFSKIFLPFYIFQWFCNDFPTFFHDVPTFSHDFPWFSHVFPWFSRDVPTFSQDFPRIFPPNPPWDGPSDGTFWPHPLGRWNPPGRINQPWKLT